MKEKELSELTDQELLEEEKKIKSTAITNAVLVGFLIGIVFYGVTENGWGFFSLIPLFFAYRLITNSRQSRSKELGEVLRERKLK